MNSSDSNILFLVKSREETLYNGYTSLNTLLSKENKDVDWKEGKKLADQMICKCHQILVECKTTNYSNDIEKFKIFSLKNQVTSMLPKYKETRAMCKSMFKATNVTAFVKENEKKLLGLYKSFKNYFYTPEGNYQSGYSINDLKSGGESKSTPAIAKCQDIKKMSVHCRVTNENEKKQLNDFLSNVNALENLFHREPSGALYDHNVNWIEFLPPVLGLAAAPSVGLCYLHSDICPSYTASNGYALILSSLIGLAVMGVAHICKRRNLQKIQRDSETAHAYIQKVEQQNAVRARLKLEKNSPPA